MIKVYVWLQNEEHVGHCALSLRDVYVSFWPDGTASAKDIKIKRSQPGRLVQSFALDVENEGNRQPITIELYNLDAGPILEYVDGLQRNTPRYQIARNNCSHIVAYALMAGAKRGPNFIPNAGHYGHLARVLGIGIWTPDQVLRFAKELKFV